jgi:hypothetical protein
LAPSGIDRGSDDRDEYKVEAIIDHDMVRGIPHYRVKWQGWPSSANTWEPIDNLGQCKDRGVSPAM